MAKKRISNHDMSTFIGGALALLGIAVIALTAFSKTDNGKPLDVMSVDALHDEMQKEIASENYEKAAIIRDLIKQKQKI